MKCFTNLNSNININVDNSKVDNDKGTVVGSTVAVKTIEPGVPVIPINTGLQSSGDTTTPINTESTDSNSASDDSLLTQTLNLVSITGLIDNVTFLKYPIIKPIIDENEVLNGKYYNINCSVGLFQTAILPIFTGTCIVEFYRAISTGDVVLDSKYLNISTGLDEISYLNAFNTWEYISSLQPTFDFTTTKALRLNFNITYFINNKSDVNYEDWINLGVRVRGIDGSGNIGFCTAITLFTP